MLIRSLLELLLLLSALFQESASCLLPQVPGPYPGYDLFLIRFANLFSQVGNLLINFYMFVYHVEKEKA